MSRRVVTWKGLNKRKTGGAGGQARLDTLSRSPVMCTSDDPGTKVGKSGTGVDSPAIKAERSADDQKQQRPHTVRPQRHKTGTRKQNTFETSGRLSRIGPTFDQLLAKYMKKKAVPHDRSIKQTKSKERSVRKQKSSKPAQIVVQPRSPGHHSLGMSWCFQVYSSLMCCHTQLWGSMAMNLYYWPNPFTYSGWGAPQVFAY
jgi:hypothetical protein